MIGIAVEYCLFIFCSIYYSYRARQILIWTLVPDRIGPSSPTNYIKTAGPDSFIIIYYYYKILLIYIITDIFTIISIM